MVNRLRDLRGGDRRLAIAVLALLLVPFVVALVRAFHDGWVPSGDEANIATRALDVFSRHPPLTGLPSTSGAYGQRIQANHPGPIEFYLLAVPVRVFGATAGPLLTAAAINAACCVVAVWVFFRRLGLTAMVGAAAVLLAVMWSGGTAVLTDTLSSNMPMYSLLGTAVLVWALVGGDLRLLPPAVVVGSYAAQQHLATGLLVGVLALVAVVAIGWRLVASRRRAGADDDAGVNPAVGTVRVGRWWVGALALAVVCWTPVAWDEIAGHPGNLGQIVRFARDGTRQTVGIGAGIDQILRVVGPPTILGRTDTTGLYFLRAPGALAAGIGVLVVVALLAVAILARARSRAVAELALVALVVLVAGGFDGGNVPVGSESWRVNLYRWTWTGAFLTWTALGLGGALVVRAVAGRMPADSSLRRARRFTPVVLTVVAAVIAASTVIVSGRDDHNRERRAFDAERAVGAAVLAHVDRAHPVVVVAQGYAAAESIQANVIFRLVQAGVRVEVSSYLAAWYGRFREYRPGSDVSAIVISSTGPRVPRVPGTVIARVQLSSERAVLIDSLAAAAARGRHLELAPGATAFIRHSFPEYPGFDALYARTIAAPPQISLRELLERPIFEPVTLRLVLAGLLRGPSLPRASVARLLALAPDHDPVGNDTVVEVRMLTPAQVRAGARRAPLSQLFDR